MTLLHRTSAGPALRGRPALPGPSAAGVSWLPVRARVVSVAVVVAAVAAGLAAPSWWVSHQVWVLALGFLVGLPHGAVDHLLPARHAWVRRGVVSMALVLLGYVGLALVAWAGLRLAGSVVLPVLLVVSVLHFGAGDLSTAPGRPLVGPGRWLAVVGRGAPVVAGPLLAWPHPTAAALATVGLGRAPGVGTSVGVGLTLLGVCVLAALAGLRAGRRAEPFEIALLVGLFVVLPPLAAFGVYFGGWHGLRHTARLVADDPRSTADLLRARVGRPLLRFLRDAALPSAVALSATAGLVAVAASHQGLAAPVFQLLLALTVPHVVVVALWDHDESARRTIHGARPQPARPPLL